MSGITKETIVAAAIAKDNKVWSVPKPGRHNHVINLICEELGIEYVGSNFVQGFLTSEGRFVDRKEAAEVARKADQRLIGGWSWVNKLYSEDLW